MAAVLFALASAAVPAFAGRLVRHGVSERPTESLLALLSAMRRTAVERGVTVTLVLDPATGRFRADSAGAAGRGVLADSALAVASSRTLVADGGRARFVFHASGEAAADSMIVRDGQARMLVLVDPRTGAAKAWQR